MKKLLNKQRMILIVISCCLLVDLFFFYSNGILRETSANFAYLQFIDKFPESISSLRVEPLFIILNYYFSKITVYPVFSIIILKNIFIALQLYLFHKIVKLFTENNLLAIASVIFLNFSFAYLSMTDNLLRNHFANIFFITSFYFIFKLFKTKKINKTESVLTALSGGFLIYSHILPTILFDFSFFLSTFFISILTFIHKKIPLKTKLAKLTTELEKIIKPLVLIGVMILLIQSPYIYKMINANVEISDYRTSSDNAEKSLTNSNTGDSKNSPLSNIQTKKTNSLIKNIILSFKDIFRIIFEYRLPGFSIFFILISFVSIILILKNIYIHQETLPLLFLWLITYFGSKVDLLFGMSTLSYRFSLMFIFPALLGILILLKHLVEKIKNTEGKIFFIIIIILIIFIGLNLPLIAETTLLKDARNDLLKQESLEKIYADAGLSKKNKKFLINGDSLEKTNKESYYTRNDMPFSTDNEDAIVSFMSAHKIDYVIFDLKRVSEKGNDLGNNINTNLELYKKLKKIENLGEYTSKNGIYLNIFKFNPNNNFLTENPNITIDCTEEKKCAEYFTDLLKKSKSPIEKWHVNLVDQGKTTDVIEFIELKNNKKIKLKYVNKNKNNSLLLKNEITKLKTLSERNNFVPTINIYIKSSLLLLADKNMQTEYINLEKFSIDKLTISGKIINSANAIGYSTLTRKGLKLLVYIFSFILIMIFYIFFLIYGKINSKKTKVFEFDSKKNMILITIILCLLFIDLFGGSIIFLEIYKKIIGI